MKAKPLDWIIFIGLCLIWGSSFILMKRGMFDANEQPTLTAFHVAALRMLSAGVILIPVAFKGLSKISAKTFGIIIISGLCGSFFPAFLFCIAETKINSALAGTLNATTPLFVIIMGTLFFNIKASAKKVIGVVTGLMGSVFLFLSHGYEDLGYIGYAFFVLLATILYGINVNTVQRYLKEVSSVQIAAIGFVALIPPSLLVLYYTGYFNLPLLQPDYLLSTTFSCILGVLGTAFASIIFYALVKRTSGLFSSLVTYGIPFVAIGWGFIAGELITLLQIACLLIILLGVYLANRQ
jgi:drug/metabolite transporter (DMT)-like permease